MDNRNHEVRQDLYEKAKATPDTFNCISCGKPTPVSEAGMDDECNDCFDKWYGDGGSGYECNNETIRGKHCGFSASSRDELEDHWLTSPKHGN
jgi:hypothetical protein